MTEQGRKEELIGDGGPPCSVCGGPAPIGGDGAAALKAIEDSEHYELTKVTCPACALKDDE